MPDEIRLKDIAKLANVAVCTASRVLSGSNLVKESTRQKVLAALRCFESQGMRVKPYMVSSLRTKALGLLVLRGRGPDRTEVTTEILEGMQEAGTPRSLATLAAPFDPAGPASDVASLFGSALVQAVVLYRVYDDDVPAVAALARSAEVPCVVLNRFRGGGVQSTCTADHRMAGTLVMDHLLGLGHRRLGILFGSLQAQPNRMRLEAIRAGSVTYRWQPDPGLIEVDCAEVPDVLAAARRLVEDKGATAVIASNDRMAARVLSDLQSRGLAIPSDVSVIGFDGTELCEHTSPRLDSVLIPWTQMARAAANLALLQAEDSEVCQAELVWQPRLVPRGSCGPPPGAPRKAKR